MKKPASVETSALKWGWCKGKEGGRKATLSRGKQGYVIKWQSDKMKPENSEGKKGTTEEGVNRKRNQGVNETGEAKNISWEPSTGTKPLNMEKSNRRIPPPRTTPKRLIGGGGQKRKKKRFFAQEKKNKSRGGSGLRNDKHDKNCPSDKPRGRQPARAK